jgi:perosamine synthetase
MTNLQAAIGVAQLGKIEEILQLKNTIQQRYEEGLKNLLQFQKLAKHSTSSYWMCSVLCGSVREKEEIIGALESNQVETRPFFTPIDELPFYNKVGDCPHSKDISARGINLPSFPALREADQDRIIALIRNTIYK